MPMTEEGKTARARVAERLALGAFDQPATMALVLGGLYVAGGVIGAASLLLPHPAEFDEGALWSNIALAFVSGVLLIAARQMLPLPAIHVAVLAGTLVVTRAVYEGHDPSGFYTYWYLWVGVFAFFFFGRFWGSVHLAAIGACYGWAIAVLPDGTPIAHWVVTIGSIAVAGFLVDYLARRLRTANRAASTRAKNLEAVSDVARQLATQSDPRAVGWAICSAALRSSGAEVAVLWRPSSKGSELVASSAAGQSVDGARIPFVAPDSGAIRAFTNAEERHDPLGTEAAAQELAPRHEAASAMWQPVQSDTAVVAVLAVYWNEQPHETHEVRQALRLLALEAAIAIERGELLGRLEEAARTDDLTGLLNRRAWSTELSRQLARADTVDSPLCVAVLDLDRFKEFNDTNGHLAGDRFLKQLAGVWSGSLRNGDILARHGGEEFALAMPHTDLDGAAELLERLRESVPGGETCSAGVCAWNGKESAEALLDRADTALYEAKDAGRDRVSAT
jgi:diguanylate cyclase (GGDEF)-like protein